MAFVNTLATPNGVLVACSPSQPQAAVTSNGIAVVVLRGPPQHDAIVVLHIAAPYCSLKQVSHKY